MEYTLFQDFARKIPRPPPPTCRPLAAQVGPSQAVHRNLATGQYFEPTILEKVSIMFFHLVCISREDVFNIKAKDLGKLNKIKIGHDNSGAGPAWYLDKVSNSCSTLREIYICPPQKKKKKKRNPNVNSLHHYNNSYIAW